MLRAAGALPVPCNQFTLSGWNGADKQGAADCPHGLLKCMQAVSYKRPVVTWPHLSLWTLKSSLTLIPVAHRPVKQLPQPLTEHQPGTNNAAGQHSTSLACTDSSLTKAVSMIRPCCYQLARES